jgi:hypothetical protein
MNWAGIVMTYLFVGTVGFLIGVYVSQPMARWMDDE